MSLLGRKRRSRATPLVHLECRWQGTLLDVVTLLPGRRQQVELPDGSQLRVTVPPADMLADAALFVEENGDGWALPVGEQQQRDSGHELFVTCAVPHEAPKPVAPVQGHFLHILMTVCAAQVCLVSSFALAPKPAPDPHSGGGQPTDQLRRYIQVFASSAPSDDAPAAVALRGHKPLPAQRVLPPKRQAPTRVAPTPASRTPARLSAQLAAIERALHDGLNDGVTTDNLGELIQASAASPQLGAEVGGLSPRTTFAAGAGNGEVGVGTNHTQHDLKKVLRKHRKEARRRRTPRKPPIAVSTVEVPEADVKPGPAAAAAGASLAPLDPLIRDHIARQVRRHRNAVRYCYETWGLTVNPHKSGRLTVDLTLHPNGVLTDIVVDVSDDSLDQVQSCVKKMAKDWYLGDALVDVPRRLSFPFILQPRQK